MTDPIRLGDFILQNMESILENWESFANTINPPALTMDSVALRDHAELMLKAIAKDLSTKQTTQQQLDKSMDLAPQLSYITAAEEHAEARLMSGFTIGQLFAEYRALRASVLQLWDLSSRGGLTTDPADITRFNEAIDQAIAESVARYSTLLKTSQDMFLAILGHDLRNPIATTIMSASLLMRSTEASDKHIAVATRIYNTSLRMNKLISDLMDYTRSQLGRKLPIFKAPSNLARICSDIVEEQQIANPERTIVLTMNGSFDGNWDEHRIAQVVSNLLGNAIQHGFTESPISLDMFSTTNKVHIHINNQGPIIHPTKIRHIFDPLVRHAENDNVDYSQKTSLGLGLYISREIVVAHDGAIDVTSNETNGTTFKVSLPS